jgi:hypothetical protein
VPKREEGSKLKSENQAIIVVINPLKILVHESDQLAELPEWFDLGRERYRLKQPNFAFADVVVDASNKMLAIRLFLNKLKVPEFVCQNRQVECDSDFSLFVWFSEPSLEHIDRGYKSLQELGWALYTNSFGHWCLVFGVNQFADFNLPELSA